MTVGELMRVMNEILQMQQAQESLKFADRMQMQALIDKLEALPLSDESPLKETKQ